MAVCALPVPKLASTAGAYTLASRAPNWLRTAAVDTIRSLPSGAELPAPRARSRAAGSPCACSAAHICGSQDTIAPVDTCAAIHRAAAVRAAAAAAMAAGAGARPVPAGAPAAGVRGGGRGAGQRDADGARAEQHGRQHGHREHPPPGLRGPAEMPAALRPQPHGRDKHLAPGRRARSRPPGRDGRTALPRPGPGATGRGAPGAGRAGDPPEADRPRAARPAGWTVVPAAAFPYRGRCGRSRRPGCHGRLLPGPSRGARSSSWSCRARATASCAVVRSCTDKITASWAASALKSRAVRSLVRAGRPSG